jgi:hypothetical protein
MAGLLHTSLTLLLLSLTCPTMGQQQHHPDKPLHWDMDKSTDELDALMRHIIDEDWVHVAWRSLANLERKLTGKCTYENTIK